MASVIFYSPLTCKANITRRKPNITAYTMQLCAISLAARRIKQPNFLMRSWAKGGFDMAVKNAFILHKSTVFGNSKKIPIRKARIERRIHHIRRHKNHLDFPFQKLIKDRCQGLRIALLVFFSFFQVSSCVFSSIVKMWVPAESASPR